MSERPKWDLRRTPANTYVLMERCVDGCCMSDRGEFARNEHYLAKRVVRLLNEADS